jgi:nitrile hydratase subunit beta
LDSAKFGQATTEGIQRDGMPSSKTGYPPEAPRIKASRGLRPLSDQEIPMKDPQSRTQQFDNPTSDAAISGIVYATDEKPLFRQGDKIAIKTRQPIGHYRVPTYLRGLSGIVEAVMRPAAVDNEEEGFGRNAGSKRHYYRVALPMTEIWPGYQGSPKDGLRIEVFETWLERI